MSKRKLVLLFACSLVPLATVIASPADLQPSVASVSGNQITLSISNPTGAAETARIRITVQLDDASTQTFTSPNITAAAGGTASVTLAGSRTITGVTDGPEPIEPL